MQLIICNNSIKKKLLNECNTLINRKFMTMKELINSYYFSYDDKAIYYLMNKYNYKYDVANIYLNNLIYIEDKEYDSDKLNFLSKLKKELDNNNLLIYDNYFKEYIKNKDIIIYSDYLNKFETNLVKELKDITNVEIISTDYKEYNHTVYEFNTMEEEVDYVAYKICELINSGVDINNIKLTNVSSDYYNTIDKIFKMYNIPINIINSSIYGTDICNYFLEEFNSDISITINNLKEKYKGELLYTTIDKNKYEKELTIKKIKIIKNLIITYKLKTPFNTYFKSNLINILGYNVEHVNTNKLISYSNISDKLKCGKMLDDLVKYGSINNDLDLYYNNYKIDYNGKNVFYNYCNIY